MKKTLIIALLILTTIASVFLCTACNNYSKTIGIIQYANHASLNNCYNGIVAGLDEAGINEANGYTIDLQISGGDASASASQAQLFTNQGVALIGAIATPSAMAAASAAKGEVPVVYCAVSDPVSAGLDVMDNVTGSSDILDCDGQVELIQAFIPTVDKIGIIYCTSESNSISQLQSMETAAQKKGIEIVSVSIGGANEIITALNSLLVTSGLDCIANLNDNTVVGCLDTVLAEANNKGIPVFGSEEEQVINGCLAGVTLDYVELGRLTGLMMAKIIKGEATANKGEYIQVAESQNVYNSTVAASFGLTAPTSLELTNVIG